MTNILVFGAGKSSSYLIKYLLEHAPKYSWQITVADANINAALERINGSSFATAVALDIHDTVLRNRLILLADIVISLLPPALHIIVANDCLVLRKNLVTASYVSEEIQALHEQARSHGLLFMNEIGLDPGIDHMSAMKIFDDINKCGGEVKSFKSYCGGLIAPENDTNPWHYKISWNPKNIVLAGSGGAHYIENHQDIKIDYKDLFNKYEIIDVPNFGKLAGYANRDSINYQKLYGFENIRTILRATFRYEDFCIGWHTIIGLGLTDDTKKIDVTDCSYYDWFMQAAKHIQGAMPSDKIKKIATKNALLAEQLLAYLEIFSTSSIVKKDAKTNAEVLQSIIEEKWKLDANDKDLVVMHHDVEYVRKDIKTRLTSTLIVKGEDKTYTAMAKTVGLPMAIFTKLFLTNKINNIVGVQIPTSKEVYKPILKELEKNGIEFFELCD